MHFGKYELGPLIAQGGMAEVYAARLHGVAGFVKTVAIKRILPHFTADPEFVRLFINEARLAAQLQHANIVQIHDFDQVDGVYYIAMELVQGKDLRRVLNRAREGGRRLSIDLALHICMEVLKGLASAHELRDPEGHLVGLVHRDLSPHNILISYAGEVKVTDFGIAKAVAPLQSQQVTTSNVIRGKLPYMSPEQVAGAPLDRRSDLFAAGLVLFELVTGQRRYDPAQEEDGLLLQVAKAEVPDPRRYNAAISPRLADVIQTLLAPRPADRFDDARAALTALRDSGGAEDRTLELAAFMRALYPEEASQGSLSAVYFAAPGGPEPADAVAPAPGAAIPFSPAEKPGSLTPEEHGVPDVPMADAAPSRSQPASRPAATPPSAASSPAGRWRRPALLGIPLAAAAAATAGLLYLGGAAEPNGGAGKTDSPASWRPGPAVGRPAPARPQAAALEVVSHPPGALVFVDGLPTGHRTPVRFGIRAGDHEIFGRWPDGATARAVRRRVRPRAVDRVVLRKVERPGAPTRHAAVPRRRPSRGPSSPHPSRGHEPPRPRPHGDATGPPRDRGPPPAFVRRGPLRTPAAPDAPRPPRPRRRVHGGRASLVVFACRPWALVRLGKRSLGQTPVLRRLPPGRYRVTFENPNLALQVHRTFRVRGDGVRRTVRCD